ncbi:MAG: pyridoxal phosphate-dependent aminotransferase [Fibrobacter sp.]|nr:pyridoxal phosphate-dependent aminotransferase [Fibrobacter sp.]
MVDLSNRLPTDLTPSPFFCELETAKTLAMKCSDFIDLTVSSPLKVGCSPDLNEAVEKSSVMFGTWTPDAQGALETRRAVAQYYKERGADFSEGQIILTASTSEAYSILFKTFCNQGDAIMTPLPGYPLLDTLAQLENLECCPYFLKLVREKKKIKNVSKNEFHFALDTDSLLTAPENAKILLVVSPHNPTGHVIDRLEWNQIVRFCEEHHLVLVVDEVFGDYGFSDDVLRSWQYGNYRCDEVEERSDDVTGEVKCPIFWLNGLSKTVGSPQLKLGWMVFYAPKDGFEQIRAALEFVEDAYLSVSSTAQALAIPLLESSLKYQERVKDCVRKNWNLLKSRFASKFCPEVKGGWYAAIRLADDDEKMVLKLLSEKHVLLQPGFFFDFDEDGWVVVSLLQHPEVFASAINRICDVVCGEANHNALEDYSNNSVRADLTNN